MGTCTDHWLDALLNKSQFDFENKDHRSISRPDPDGKMEVVLALSSILVSTAYLN